MFNLNSAYIKVFDYSQSGTYPIKVVCELEFDAREWAKERKQGNLGMFYNRELSNYLYQITNGRFPHALVQVDESKQASKGRKHVTVEFFVTWDKMGAIQALGFPCRTRAWNSKDDIRVIPEYRKFLQLIKEPVINVSERLNEIYDSKQRSEK